MSRLREGLLASALALLVYTNGLAGMYIHADESAWISSSNLFDEFIQGRFSSPVWNEDYNHRVGTSILFNSTVTRFIIGTGRKIGGIGPEQLNAPYDFSLTREQNAAAGRMPAPELLWWSRIVISLLSAAGIVISFLLIRDVTGRVAGFVWLMLSLTSTYFLFSLRTALDEGPLVFGCVLVTWAIARFLGRAADSGRVATRNRSHLFWLCLMGVGAGYSAGVKLNGAVLIVPCLIAVLVATYLSRAELRRRVVTGALSASMVIGSAYLTFLAPNPYLWRNPVQGPARMVETRLRTMESQFDGFPELRIPSGWPHVKLAATRIYSTFSPLNSSPFQGWYVAPGSIDAPFIFVNLTLTLIGLAYCARKSTAWLATGDGLGASATAILLVSLCASAPALAINLDQARYYVIPVYFSTILLAIGVDSLSQSRSTRVPGE